MKKHGQIGKLESVEIGSINGDSNIMTGQEWYDRFTKIIDSVTPHQTPDRSVVWSTTVVYEAAKKAAGL